MFISKKLGQAVGQKWLVTGVAGFVGSHLAECLLQHDQKVVGLDNFSTGLRENITLLQGGLSDSQKANFTMIEGDIRDTDTCEMACKGVDYILHQAALGSVPRSIKDPVSSHLSNVDGFLNMLVAARDNRVKRFVYASSSSVYGDHPDLPKVENKIGKVLSPYALTKLIDEQYAEVFSRCYGLEVIGLRYFNIFGPRQNENGAYAAVIPKWISAFLNEQVAIINGDGKNSRDFCFIDNAVQANLKSALVQDEKAIGQVFNVAYGEQTSLLELHAMIKSGLADIYPNLRILSPEHREQREGDVLHSLADIKKAQNLINYKPSHSICEGMRETLDWYAKHMPKLQTAS